MKRLLLIPVAILLAGCANVHQVDLPGIWVLRDSRNGAGISIGSATRREKSAQDRRVEETFRWDLALTRDGDVLELTPEGVVAGKIAESDQPYYEQTPFPVVGCGFVNFRGFGAKACGTRIEIFPPSKPSCEMSVPEGSVRFRSIAFGSNSGDAILYSTDNVRSFIAVNCLTGVWRAIELSDSSTDHQASVSLRAVSFCKSDDGWVALFAAKSLADPKEGFSLLRFLGADARPDLVIRSDLRFGETHSLLCKSRFLLVLGGQRSEGRGRLLRAVDFSSANKVSVKAWALVRTENPWGNPSMNITNEYLGEASSE